MTDSPDPNAGKPSPGCGLLMTVVAVWWGAILFVDPGGLSDGMWALSFVAILLLGFVGVFNLLSPLFRDPSPKAQQLPDEGSGPSSQPIPLVVEPPEKRASAPVVFDPKEQRADAQPRAIWPACLLFSALLLVGSLDLPYGYYVFLRWAIFLGVGGLSAVLFSFHHLALGALAAPIAVLFNPILSVYLEKETWRVIDFVCASVLVVAAVVYRPGVWTKE